MFGAGLPVALQNKLRLEPSFTVWLSLYDVNLGGTERKEYDNVLTDYYNEKLFIETWILKVVVTNLNTYVRYCAIAVLLI